MKTKNHATDGAKRHNKAEKSKKKSQKKPEKKRHLLRKIAGAAALGAVGATTATVVGGVATWQYLTHQKGHRRHNLSAFDNVISAKPFVGKAHRDAQTFTLTTAAKIYHVVDPLAIIDDLAKEQGATSPYYDCVVRVLGEVSPKGRYGYLGHLDYQLTVTGRAEDEAIALTA